MAVDYQQRDGYKAADYINQALSNQGDGTGVTEQAIASQTITAATDASPNVYTLTSHGFSNGDFVFISGETGSTTANGLRIIASKTDNTFQLTDPAGTAINSDGTFAGTVLIWDAFVYKPTSAQNAKIQSLRCFATDATQSAGYLGVSALSNGIDVHLYTNDTQTKTLTAAPVKKFQQWKLNGSVEVQSGDAGAGTVTQGFVKWDFTDSGGPIQVDGSTDQLIAVIVRDTLTGLTGQEMSVQGHL
jgi:hypothetical protein